jgi:hypothetical protein
MADYNYFRKLAADQVGQYSAALEAEEDFAAGLDLLRYSEAQLQDEKRALEAQLQDQKLALEVELQNLKDKYENLLSVQREAFQASIRAAEETAKLEREAGIQIGEKRASDQRAHELTHYKNLVAKLRRAFFLRRMSRRRRLIRLLLPSRLRGWWDRRNVDRLAQLVASSGKFDARWYLTTYPDVAASGVDPIRHYLEFGAPEGRNPSPDFDTTSYLADHPMLSVWGLNPFVAFIVAEQQKKISQSTKVQVVQKREA